jgi:ureidoacrylate peracid hydrolase
MPNTLAGIDRNQAAVVVIDMQNDFCHPSLSPKRGESLTPEQAIVTPIKKLVRAARDSGVPVIFARFVLTEHAAQRNNLRHLPREDGSLLCREGTWGADWFEVRPEPGDAIVTKHRNSAFIGTDFDLILRAKGITSLLLTGTRTNICVEATARDGHMLGYNCVILSDCTCAGSEEAHERGLAGAFAERATSSDVIDGWLRQPKAAAISSSASER